ncbi:MAG: hypothetical protein WA913_12115 [Pricia sp.]
MDAEHKAEMANKAHEETPGNPSTATIDRANLNFRCHRVRKKKDLSIGITTLRPDRRTFRAFWPLPTKPMKTWADSNASLDSTGIMTLGN